ncbi:MAG: DUF4367 domain-containing protein [Eubacteriales bacterium]|nr:DUF4367 domain-containing protein [Eubacteriales bacterium]
MNKSNTELWDSVLKEAVLQNSLEETEMIVNGANINPLILPEGYDRHMRRLVSHLDHPFSLFQYCRIYTRKAAAVILIITGVALTVLFQNTEVRAACRNLIIQFYHKYIQYDLTPDYNVQEVPPSIVPEYLPPGFCLADIHSDPGYFRAIYKNDSEEEIRLNYIASAGTIHIDNEHYMVYDMQIGNYNGLFFQAQSPDYMNQLTWNTEDGIFRLASTQNADIMKKIAESIIIP